MRTEAKARIALAVTFVLGVAVGAFAVATLLRPPRPVPDRASAKGELPRFVREMERYLRLHHDAQRAALRPLLMSTDSLNRETVDRAQEAMREGLLQLRARALPLLDATQVHRLDQFIDRKAVDGRSRPAPGPPSGGSSGRP